MSISSTSFLISATCYNRHVALLSPKRCSIGRRRGLEPRRRSLALDQFDLASVAGAQPLFIHALLIFHALDHLLEILQLRTESFGDEHAHERAVFDHGHIHASPEHLWRCGAR